MADELGLIVFPGLAQVMNGSFTLSAGTKASVATIEVPAQLGFVPAVGTMRIEFGSVVLSFADCRVSQIVQRRGHEGWVWTVSILDRRWKWEFGAISGHYNERTRQGAFLQTTRKKTPRELAALCFQAMGENNYDLSLLPNDNYPEVNWDAIYAHAALQDLLDKTGCLIVLRTNGVAKIYRIGDGASLPVTAVMNASFTFDPPEKPDSLKFVGAPIKYQAKFSLEAVGLDNDGKVKLEADLSYKPAAGSLTPPTFAEVVDVDDRKLAQGTLFRWYRVKTMLNTFATLSIPDLITLKSIDQVVLLDELVQIIEDPQTGEKKPRQPFVIGTHRSGDLFRADTDTTKRAQVGFRIVPDTNLIEFEQPVYLGKSGGGATGATGLSLETAFVVKDEVTRAITRYEIDRGLGGNLGTKARIVKHDEIVLTKRAIYSGTAVAAVQTNDTTDQVSEFANRYLDAVTAEYRTEPAMDRSFAGIVDLSPDGAISQVTWSVGRSGATTRASRGVEHSVIVPDYAQRRRAQKIKAVFDESTPPQHGLVAIGPFLGYAPWPTRGLAIR